MFIMGYTHVVYYESSLITNSSLCSYPLPHPIGIRGEGGTHNIKYQFQPSLQLNIKCSYFEPFLVVLLDSVHGHVHNEPLQDKYLSLILLFQVQLVQQYMPLALHPHQCCLGIQLHLQGLLQRYLAQSKIHVEEQSLTNYHFPREEASHPYQLQLQEVYGLLTPPLTQLL